jgi:hypothetical protein
MCIATRLFDACGSVIVSVRWYSVQNETRRSLTRVSFCVIPALKQRRFGPSACSLGLREIRGRNAPAGMSGFIAGEPGRNARGIEMAKQGSSASKTPAARSDQNASGGSAGIEIVGFPQKLYTRTFGDSDTLFVPFTGGSAMRTKCWSGSSAWGRSVETQLR